LASHDIEMAAEESVVSASACAISVKTPQPVISPTHRTLSKLEKIAQADAVGWAVAKAVQQVNCDACRSAFVSSDVEKVSHSFYISARSYGGLTHPTNELLHAMKLVESIFQYNRASFSCLDNIDEDIVKQAVDALETTGYVFPDCHDSMTVIIQKYVHMRIREHAVSYTRQKAVKRQYGS
jgi:hypothetical protein